MKKIQVKLKRVLSSRNITQKELAEMTGISQAQISTLSRGVSNSINKEHIEKIANALSIDDIRELVDFC